MHDRVEDINAAPDSKAHARKMRITVDRTRCTGHARCLIAAPNLITLDEEGFAVALDTDVPADQLEAALEAQLDCPEGAIAVAENKDLENS